ncbi:MAG: phage portal protein [Devosia sp.]|nr:phage portal protein [Devosia sp.]
MSRGPTAAGVHVNIETALNAPAVAAAIRTISEAAACLDVHVVKIAADGTETRVPGHPVKKLLSGQANDWTSSFELIRSLVVDALTHDRGGLAWVGKNSEGKPVEMIRYRPGYIQVNYPDDSLRPEYRIGGLIKPISNIIHLKGAFDKSPVSLAREAIGTAISMEKHAGRLFGAGGRPSGVLTTPKPVGDEGAKKMIAGWKRAFEGPDRSGGTAVLWDGADWKAATMTSVDSQFQQLRLFALQEIARAFNMPASILGDLTRATWSNSAEMQRQFLALCLDPWLKALENALGRALFTDDERATHAIRFDRDDFTNVDLTARATAINGLISSRVLNPNEGRNWLGMGPRDGGDEYANPNTGSSQPGDASKTGPTPDVNAADKTKNQDDPDADE